MDCERALEAISAALDGELSPTERAELEAHLSSCPACRALAEELSVLNAALERSEAAPPQSLAEQVMERIAGENKVVPISAGRRRGWRRWMGVAAALALVVCAGGLGMWLRGGIEADNTSGAPMAYSGGYYPQPSSAAGTSEGSEWTDMDAEAPTACDGVNAGAEPGAAPFWNGDAAPAMPEPAPAMEAPEDAPSAVPSAKASAPGSSWQEIVGSCNPCETLEDDVSIDSEKALNLVFEHLGGYQSFPAAQLRYTTVYGALTPAYCLRTQTVGDTELSEFCLDYVRLSTNALYHEIHLYETVTDLTNAANSTNTFNWFAVDVDGSGEILEEFPPDYDEERTEEYIDSYQNAVAGDQ